MCGRFSLYGGLDKLQARFGFERFNLAFLPSSNIAPTDQALAIVNNKAGQREAALLRWGLIPHFAKDPREGVKAINARAETLTERPTFREAFQKRRCLLLADGFYEWRKDGAARIPIRYALASGDAFPFAGLFAWWKGPDGWVASCSIVTTEANDLIRPVHDRMPVILSEEAARLWMDRSIEDPGVLTSVLTPFPGASMKAIQVGRAVNDVRNKGPECAEAA